MMGDFRTKRIVHVEKMATRIRAKIQKVADAAKAGKTYPTSNFFEADKLEKAA